MKERIECTRCDAYAYDRHHLVCGYHALICATCLNAMSELAHETGELGATVTTRDIAYARYTAAMMSGDEERAAAACADYKRAEAQVFRAIKAWCETKVAAEPEKRGDE